MPLIHSGKIFKLSKKTFKLPNGRTVKYDVIEHPGAVIIVPVINKDSVVMLRQYRASIGKYIYEFPAGTIESKERPVICAKRELEEETGFKAGKISAIGKVYSAPGYSTEVLYAFKAEKLKKGALAREKDEIMKTVVISKKRLKTMLDRGQLVDAKTVSALVFAKII